MDVFDHNQLFKQIGLDSKNESQKNLIDSRDGLIATNKPSLTLAQMLGSVNSSIR
jgi:hypothetical protein